MLDFYIIRDEQSKPDDPEQVGLEFAGGLDDKSFANLKKKGIIDARFDYYSDFRLGTTLIKQIRQTILQRKLTADTDVKNLLDIFEKADKSESGLIGYAD